MVIQDHRSRAEATTWAPGTLLSALDAADRDALLGLGTRRRFGPGEALINEGSRDADPFVLLRGCAKVLGNTLDGRTVLLSIRLAGDLVGDLAAVDDQPRSASVVAATGVVASAVGRPAFVRYLDEHPRAARAIHAAVVGELRRSTRLRVEVTGAPIRVRAALVLLHLMEAYGRGCPDGVRIEVPLSQPELASLAGVSGPSLHRALARLRTQGVILTRYRRLTVRDPAALRALASDPPETSRRPRR